MPFALQIDTFFSFVNDVFASFLFFNVLGFTEELHFPFIVAWLIFGAFSITLYMRFINFRAFGHALQVVAGKYDHPHNEGEVTHFQALVTALSGTVGLGNIAGVAIAVGIGGPGATFWMILAGLLGMSAKFAECSASLMYREIRPDGHVMGGAMYYIRAAFSGPNPVIQFIGKTLAVIFCFFCIGASLGGGNAFQVSQSCNGVQEALAYLFGGQNSDYDSYRWIMGLIISGVVFVVIIGGIRGIATATEKIVPLMCGIYLILCAWILLNNLSEIPSALSTIISSAFQPAAGYGGFIGVLVQGFKRAAFSNEAGVGSSAIAHSAAKTNYPVREGLVAMLEPFIDTVVICTFTALIIVITGVYDQSKPEYGLLIQGARGSALTARAMSMEVAWFPLVLSFCIVLFAISTTISWSYYGERCWCYLFGDQASLVYKILYCVICFIATLAAPALILNFSDLMLLGMAIPNLIAVYLLTPKIREQLDSYWKDYKSGKIKPYQQKT